MGMETDNRTAFVDVAELIDQQPVSRFQIRVIALCAGVVFMDGFDTQAIGYVAPTLGKLWNLKPGALGPVFGAGLFGLMLGALIGGGAGVPDVAQAGQHTLPPPFCPSLRCFAHARA